MLWIDMWARMDELIFIWVVFGRVSCWGFTTPKTLPSKCGRETFVSLLLAQVSWSLPHKQASSGTYQVKFFDEESYSALRKVNDRCDELCWLRRLLKQQQLNVKDCKPSSPGPEKQRRCKRHWAALLCQHWPQGESLIGQFGHKGRFKPRMMYSYLSANVKACFFQWKFPDVWKIFWDTWSGHYFAKNGADDLIS